MLWRIDARSWRAFSGKSFDAATTSSRRRTGMTRLRRSCPSPEASVPSVAILCNRWRWRSCGGSSSEAVDLNTWRLQQPEGARLCREEDAVVRYKGCRPCDIALPSQLCLPLWPCDRLKTCGAIWCGVTGSLLGRSPPRQPTGSYRRNARTAPMTYPQSSGSGAFRPRNAVLCWQARQVGARRQAW